MERTDIVKMVKLAKENLSVKFRNSEIGSTKFGYYSIPIDELSWQINQPIKNLYRWVELVTLRAGLCYAGNLDEWSIPSTRYVMETIEKIVTRRTR